MHVVHAGPEHAETVAGLLHAFNTEFDAAVPPRERLTARFRALLARADVLVVLAVEDDEPLGFAYLTLRPTPYYDGPLAQLEEPYVRPERRGTGIGTHLLTRALDELAVRRCGEVHIDVDEVDEAARRFYERHGFVNIEPGNDYRMLCYLREL